jgi:hypothetical protein
MPCLLAKFNESKTVSLDDLLQDTDKAFFTEECSEAMDRLPNMESLDLGKSWKKLLESVIKSPEKAGNFSEDDETIPDVETMRLLKEEDGAVRAIAASGSSSIELTGPLAFLSLASLFIVIGTSVYKLFRWRMNKGYMVIVEKE